MEVLLYTVLTLCVLGILAALILYFVAQKFKVEEDPTGRNIRTVCRDTRFENLLNQSNDCN